MQEVKLENGRKALIGKIGITVGETCLTWADLCDAMEAASLCCTEGSREWSDLIQCYSDYLPSLRSDALEAK